MQTHSLPLLLAFVFTGSGSGQDIRDASAPPANIKTIVAQGRVVGTDYRNDYFHLIVHVPGPNTFQEINTIVTENRACDFKHRLAALKPSFGHRRPGSPLDSRCPEVLTQTIKPSVGRKYRIRAFPHGWVETKELTL